MRILVWGLGDLDQMHEQEGGHFIMIKKQHEIMALLGVIL